MSNLFQLLCATSSIIRTDLVRILKILVPKGESVFPFFQTPENQNGLILNRTILDLNHINQGQVKMFVEMVLRQNRKMRWLKHSKITSINKIKNSWAKNSALPKNMICKVLSSHKTLVMSAFSFDRVLFFLFTVLLIDLSR